MVGRGRGMVVAPATATEVGAVAPVLALDLVVAVSMCGARFVGGVVGAAGAVVSALTL